MALGAGADGKLKAIVHSGVTVKTPHNAMPEPFTLPTRSAYATETMRLEVKHVELDMVGNTFMRAPGESVGTFALECAMDELAERLEIDPIELRLRNEPDKDPLTGLPFSSRRIADAWKAGAARRSPVSAARATGWSGSDVRRQPIPIIACPVAPRGSL